MFVILAYDIKVKRVAKVRKIVKKYLHPVQKSVFEGFLTEGRLKYLKKELQKVIECDEDSVRIYRFQSTLYASVEELGVVTGTDSIVL